MSNIMKLNSLKFENTETGEINYGFYLRDDYGSVFYDGYEKIDLIKNKGLKLLKKILIDDIISLEEENILKDMLMYTFEDEKGVHINGEYFEFDQVKNVIKEEDFVI